VFTGLVQHVGTITAVSITEAGRTFRIAAPWTDLADGESIAVDGACLTVRERGAGWFTVAAVVTTLGRTTMDAWDAGRRVNLERAMQVGERLGGHIVQGHVDGVGRVVMTRAEGDAWLIDVALPEGLDRLLVLHGAITVDGVSLTVNALPAPGTVQLSIIEYTLRHTTLGERRAGDAVHVEADIIAKHVQRLLAPYGAAAGGHAAQGTTA